MSSPIDLVESINNLPFQESTGSIGVSTGDPINNQWLVENYIEDEINLVDIESAVWEPIMGDLIEKQDEAWKTLADL